MKLLTLGANPHIRDGEGNTLLMIAAARGFTDLMDVLFNHNLGSLEDVNNDGNNALIIAALNNCINSAVLLLRRGSSLDFQNKEGRLAYHYCAAVPGLFSRWVQFKCIVYYVIFILYIHHSGLSLLNQLLLWVHLDLVQVK